MRTPEDLQALMPWAEFLGMYTDPRVNHGAPTPRFAIKSPADGRPGINTAEGWNALAQRTNRLSFVDTFGREPVDDAEVSAWVRSLATE